MEYKSANGETLEDVIKTITDEMLRGVFDYLIKSLENEAANNNKSKNDENDCKCYTKEDVKILIMRVREQCASRATEMLKWNVIDLNSRNIFNFINETPIKL